MKYLLSLLLFILFADNAFSRHIKGGWIQYEYVGASSTAGKSDYKITVYVFKNCDESGGRMPTSLGIFDAVTYATAASISGTDGSYTLITTATKGTFDPCLSNPPRICYGIYKYTVTLSLPDNANGYIIAASDANRVTGIINITNSVNTGITFTGYIPGTINSTDYHINSSPYFEFKDTAVICYSSKFEYQFHATDADGDSLSYSLDNGINGASTLTSPPYNSVPYSSGYSGATPLGNDASINAQTGLISGISPAATGEYIIAVYVHEWRNGVKINSTKKELQITVDNCSLSAASLKLSYINCDDYFFQFQNETTSSNINSYLWSFGDKNTSTAATPAHTYADTGKYILKLVVSNTGGCKDSAQSTVKVYPGFKPSFTVAGSCYQSPFTFTSTSTTKYGFIDSYVWDFGDPNSTSDTSTQKAVNYTYSAAGNVTATMSVTSNLGCAATITNPVVINSTPQIILPFSDTLICSIDSLPLIAQSPGGVFQWTPNSFIINANTANPTVFPKDTTIYTITVTDKGCVGTKTVTVNVLDFITVKLPLDSGICKTDSIILQPVSDALSYRWRESGGLYTMSDSTVKYPKVAPLDTTTYFVEANLGKCQDKAQITIYPSPYPTVNAGADAAICFGNRVQLNGSFTGAYFNWSPVSTLYNGTTLFPVAGPQQTTSYILTASDTFNCKKTVSDTVIVKVIPLFNINAGNDTSVVINQPLQLYATGDSTTLSYQWKSATYLNNAFTSHPIATFSSNATDIVKLTVTATTAEGCTATDDISIKVYKSLPAILVPSGFTPDNNGINDILKPILLGISQLNYFNVYNRYGQLIYSTSQSGKGWDGTLNGNPQGAGTYVFMAQGIDYTGQSIFTKGTVVLIK